MKVRLLEDIKNEKGQLRETKRRSRGLHIVWKAGAILDMSETSAKKWIDAGYAELVGADQSE